MKKNIKDYVKSNHFFVMEFIYYKGSEKNEKKVKIFIDLASKKCYIICAFGDSRQKN